MLPSEGRKYVALDDRTAPRRCCRFATRVELFALTSNRDRRRAQPVNSIRPSLARSGPCRWAKASFCTHRQVPGRQVPGQGMCRRRSTRNAGPKPALPFTADHLPTSPSRCWPPHGPPIPLPSRARDGHSGPWSGSWCARAASRSSAGIRRAPAPSKRSCAGGHAAERHRVRPWTGQLARHG